MRKLTLNLEDLTVDSFDTAQSARERGTAKEWWWRTEGWSDASVCPTTVTTECKPCN